MISEKTVELNLTTELLNCFFGLTGRVHYVIAPSARLEARLGFDAAIMPASGGGGILIQFKRAHVNGSIFTWRLNRTTLRDQHARLLRLENYGIPVYYAFPLFSAPQDVAHYRRRLLIHTVWPQPSMLNVPGGGIGHHEVHFDRNSGRWWLTSEEEIELRKLPDFNTVSKIMDLAFERNNLLDLCESFFSIYMKPEIIEDKDPSEIKRILINSVQRLDLFVRHRVG